MKVFLVEDSAAIRNVCGWRSPNAAGQSLARRTASRDAIRAIRQCCPQLVILDIVLAQNVALRCCAMSKPICRRSG